MSETPSRRFVASEAVDHLRACDAKMAELVERLGHIDYAFEPDLWRALVGSIVGQQLSVAAARTIRGRVAALGRNGFPAPEELLDVPEQDLRGCGLSRAKISYVRDIARQWAEGELVSAEIAALPDEAVIERLVRVRGVGRWTAEMVLIFSLGRPDVLAVDDLGLRAAAQNVYDLPDRPARDNLLRIGEAWRPYRSAASLYLWRSLQG